MDHALRKTLDDSQMILFDNYEKVRDIGTGATDSVALYKCLATDELWACRTFMGDDPKLFCQEMDALRLLPAHPCIGAYHGYSMIPPGIWLEYLPGGSLASILALQWTKRPLPPSYTPTVKAKTIFGIAAAMMHVHAHNAVHRYLTPKNILYDAQSEPHLVDFGQAKCTHEFSKYSRAADSCDSEFQAPEVIENGEYNQTIDTFSYGMIVYSIVSPTKPYHDRKSPFKMREDIVRGKRPPRPSDCHPKLQQIIVNCWAQCPNDRPSFAEIVSEFLAFDEPLFPGVEMSEYRSFRDRVFRASHCAEGEKEFFEDRASLTSEDVAAFAAMKDRADRGDRDAQVRVGLFYSRGYGTPKNLGAAAEYWTAAAESGDGNAMHYLGTVLAQFDAVAACRWFERAAIECRMPRAILSFAVHLLHGDGVRRDVPRATDMLMGLARENNCQALYQLGKLYGRPENRMLDLPRAIGYLETAAGLGDRDSKIELARQLIEVNPTPENERRAVQTYEEDAANGGLVAMFSLGHLYQAGKAVPPNERRAREYFRLAAEGGYAPAMVKHAGVLLAEGDAKGGVDGAAMLAEAARFLCQAAQQQNDVAQHNYGRLLLTGRGVQQNLKLAGEYFLLGAKQGRLQSMEALAVMFEQGLGIDRPDPDMALRIRQKADEAKRTRKV
jgi:TPR repeat protein